MDRDQTWQLIAEQRLRLADLLDSLSDNEWQSPSLCTGWRVRDVAAHVALAPQAPSPGSMLAAGVRARGSFNRLNDNLTFAHAARPTAQIVDELRRYAASRSHPPVTNERNIAFDILVHGQDIAVPLGRDYPMPRDGAVAGASRVWSMGWPFWARRRLRGVTLTATDTGWMVGRGPEVSGPIQALLLLLTGRFVAAVPELAGPGLAQLPAYAAHRRLDESAT